MTHYWRIFIDVSRVNVKLDNIFLSKKLLLNLRSWFLQKIYECNVWIGDIKIITQEMKYLGFIINNTLHFKPYLTSTI